MIPRVHDSSLISLCGCSSFPPSSIPLVVIINPWLHCGNLERLCMPSCSIFCSFSIRWTPQNASDMPWQTADRFLLAGRRKGPRLRTWQDTGCLHWVFPAATWVFMFQELVCATAGYVLSKPTHECAPMITFQYSKNRVSIFSRDFSKDIWHGALHQMKNIPARLNCDIPVQNISTESYRTTLASTTWKTWNFSVESEVEHSWNLGICCFLEQVLETWTLNSKPWPVFSSTIL